MTDLNIYRKDIFRYRGIFLFFIFASISLGVYLGLRISTAESCIIIPKSPFGDGGFFEGVIKVCFCDILAFWILTLPVSRVMTVFLSSCVFFFRGIVIGNGSRTFFANSTSAVCIVIFLSYIAVTFFLLIYDGYINTNGKKDPFSRILSCFIATGGCTVIRILPMLLIK